MTEEITPVDGPDRDVGIQAAPESFDPDGSAEALVIRDCVIWDTTANEDVLDELGIENDVVNSDSLGQIEFSDYSVVVIPSTQPGSYYQTLVDRKEDIATFVENGGVLVAHTIRIGWPCRAFEPFDYLPRDVDAPVDIDGDSDILIPDHPAVESVIEDDLSRPFASLSYLRGLPDDAEVVAVNSNGSPTYAEYAHGDGAVLATGYTMEWPWTPTGDLSTGVVNKDFLRNELEYAAEIADAEPSPTEVSCKLTSLSFIPGGNENVSEGGDPLNGATCHFFDENQTLPVDLEGGGPVADPLFDNWGKGDMVNDLPDDLDEALIQELNKYEEDPFESHPQYRVINQIQVEFETSDGETIDNDLDEGEEVAEHTFGAAQSVIVQDDINNLPQEWYENREPSDKLHIVNSNVEGRNEQYAEKVVVDSVEGIRAIAVAGAGTTVGDIAEEKIQELGASGFLGGIWGEEWEDLGEDPVVELTPFISSIRDTFVEVPNIYTFLELICLADGRKVMRIWDTSPFPEHKFYLDDESVASLVFGFDYEEKEHLNPFFLSFIAQAVDGVTPFKSTSLLEYLELLREGSPYPDFFDTQSYNAIFGPLGLLQPRDSIGDNKVFRYPYLTIGVDEDDEFMDESEKDEILNEIEEDVPDIRGFDPNVSTDGKHDEDA